MGTFFIVSQIDKIRRKMTNKQFIHSSRDIFPYISLEKALEPFHEIIK